MRKFCLISTDRACKSAPNVRKRVWNVYIFQLSFHFRTPLSLVGFSHHEVLLPVDAGIGREVVLGDDVDALGGGVEHEGLVVLRGGVGRRERQLGVPDTARKQSHFSISSIRGEKKRR